MLPCTIYLACFPSEVINVYVKDEATTYMLVCRRNLFTSMKNLKGDPYSLDLFCNVVLPIIIAIGITNDLSILRILWDFYTKYMCALVIPGVYCREESISFLECKMYPPSKTWFFVYTLRNCKFSNVNRVRFF